MTAQIGDSIKINNKLYEIVSDLVLFSPSDYGLKPIGSCSACRRGYWCEYLLVSNKLILDKIHVNTLRDVYPSINGVEAKETKHKWNHYVYSNLNMYVEFSGKFLIGDGFIERYYKHTGRQYAWGYKTLFEYQFLNGVLSHIDDKTKTARKIREIIDARYDDYDEYESLALAIASDLKLKGVAIGGR